MKYINTTIAVILLIIQLIHWYFMLYGQLVFFNSVLLMLVIAFEYANKEVIENGKNGLDKD